MASGITPDYFYISLLVAVVHVVLLLCILLYLRRLSSSHQFSLNRELRSPESTDCGKSCATFCFSTARFPSYVTYVHPLTKECKRFNKLCKDYRKAIMSSDSKQLDDLTQRIMADNRLDFELKVFALCYQGLRVAMVQYDLVKAQSILMDALAITERRGSEFRNRQLLEGRIYRIYAAIPRKEGNYQEALRLIEKSKCALYDTAPSCENACLLVEEALIMQLSLGPNISDKAGKEIEEHFDRAFRHCCNDRQDPQRAHYTVSLVHLRKALFYLNPFANLPNPVGDNFIPTKDNIDRAEWCLKQVRLDIVGGANTYEMEYNVAYSDIYRFRQQYPESLRRARKANALQIEAGIVNDLYHVKERLQLLETGTDQHTASSILDRAQEHVANMSYSSRESSHCQEIPDVLTTNPVFEQRPTMRELQLLKSRWMAQRKEELRVIESVQHRWQRLGDILQVPPSVLGGYEQWQDSERCCRAVFKRWLDSGSSIYSVTWRGLIRALEDADLRVIANDLKKILPQLRLDESTL